MLQRQMDLIIGTEQKKNKQIEFHIFILALTNPTAALQKE